ncbi:hypothetical protein [Nocardia aurea]|uniref:Transposase IS701-like DDE domain-containing protein n=1 Tax=Nocardia aurea TaxID=2144174 RepID=A0ABV3G330_9NOCA
MSAPTFDARLAALRSACRNWREQTWLVGGPVTRIRPRSAPADRSRAMTRAEVTALLDGTADLCERVLWHMLCETTARAEEPLLLAIDDLDTVNRCGARAALWTWSPGRPVPRGCCLGCSPGAVPGRCS